MSFWKRLLLEPLRIVERLYDQFRFFLQDRLGIPSDAPIIVTSYGGYCAAETVYLQGRVMKDLFIISQVGDSRWRNMINAYKRFGTGEIPDAEVQVTIGNNVFNLLTDEEGYFRLDDPLSHPLTLPERGWYPVQVHLIRTPFREVHQVFNTEVRVISPQASFGVISDIDDTILKTDVTFPLKLMAIYHTVLKNAAGRRTFQEVAAFYQSLHCSSDCNRDNPFFYVSRSPWNLHDLLEEFLQLNRLPRGPILLRDFGIPSERVSDASPGHKYERIVHLMETFPGLPFVLIGDSGEKDTDIYLDIDSRFPGRILAIYIRDVRSRRRARRIQTLIRTAGRDNVLLVSDFREAAVDAARRGLMDLDFFESQRK